MATWAPYRFIQYCACAVSLKATCSLVKMATSKRRRTDLTLGQKLETVRVKGRERPSQAELAKRVSCAQSTISKITKSKDALLKEAEENKLTTRKRKRADDVDAAFYTWLVDARARDAPITPEILEEKANHFASVLEKDFKATNGWLCRWKTRHGIKLKKSPRREERRRFCGRRYLDKHRSSRVASRLLAA